MALSNLKLILKNSKSCPNQKIEIKEKKNIKADKKTNNTLLSKIVLKGVPKNSFWFSLDNGRGFSPHLNQTKDIQKVCDAVAAVKWNNTDCLIFIEMKSTTAEKDDINNKFKATECFVDYCGLILDRFYNDKSLFKCKKHFILFCVRLPLPKTPTRLTKSHSSDKGYEIVQYSKAIPIKKILRMEK